MPAIPGQVFLPGSSLGGHPHNGDIFSGNTLFYIIALAHYRLSDDKIDTTFDFIF